VLGEALKAMSDPTGLLWGTLEPLKVILISTNNPVS
jgi:hypothetical protein